jgi:hypothetical protein
MVKWSHNEEITAEEFIKRIKPMVCDPVSTMIECDGDMWLSDYQKLVSAFYRLTSAVEEMDKKDG